MHYNIRIIDCDARRINVYFIEEYNIIVLGNGMELRVHVISVDTQNHPLLHDYTILADVVILL